MVEQKQMTDRARSSLLKETRETQGLDLETVHEATKIPLDVLKAIEEGYTVRTLSPFYLKAFKKKYAEYLRIDINNVVEDYHPEKLPKPMRIVREDEQRRIRIQVPQALTREHQQLIFKAVVVLLVLFAVSRIFSCGRRSAQSTENNMPILSQAKSAGEPVQIEGQSPVSETRAPSSAEAKPASAVKTVSAEKSESAGKTASKTKAAAAKKSSATDKQQADKTESSNRKITVQSPKAEPVLAAAQESGKKTGDGDSLPDRQAGAQAAPAAPSKNVKLVVKARKSSWLQVKVDDTLVFQSTLSKGTVESWQADDAIELSGNNVGELEFEVNGKAMGALGRNDQNARRVVITKNGLTVKK